LSVQLAEPVFTKFTAVYVEPAVPPPATPPTVVRKCAVRHGALPAADLLGDGVGAPVGAAGVVGAAATGADGVARAGGVVAGGVLGVVTAEAVSDARPDAWVPEPPLHPAARIAVTATAVSPARVAGSGRCPAGGLPIKWIGMRASGIVVVRSSLWSDHRGTSAPA